MAGRVYNLARWRRLSAQKLAANPLCEDCQARDMVVISRHVDHVIAIAAGGDPWDWQNLRSLCIGCHSEKTRAFDDPRGSKKRKIKGADVHGMPLDPDHAWRK